MKEIFIVSTHVSPIFDPYVYKVVKFLSGPIIIWQKSREKSQHCDWILKKWEAQIKYIPKIFFAICQSVKIVTWKN